MAQFACHDNPMLEGKIQQQTKQRTNGPEDAHLRFVFRKKKKKDI